eukprot:scaffold7149_cov54-Phaeocystis_antarctica.AAC.2
MRAGSAPAAPAIVSRAMATLHVRRGDDDHRVGGACLQHALRPHASGARVIGAVTHEGGIRAAAKHRPVRRCWSGFHWSAVHRRPGRLQPRRSTTVSLDHGWGASCPTGPCERWLPIDPDVVHAATRHPVAGTYTRAVLVNFLRGSFIRT